MLSVGGTWVGRSGPLGLAGQKHPGLLAGSWSARAPRKTTVTEGMCPHHPNSYVETPPPMGWGEVVGPLGGDGAWMRS